MTKIFLLDDKNYATRIEEHLRTSYELKTFSNLKELYNSILPYKPQLILLPVRNTKKSKKLLAKFTFIPIALYGEYGKTLKQANKKIHKFLQQGYAACINVQTILNKDEFISEIEKLLWKALSKENIWEKEYNISARELKVSFWQNLIFSITVFIIIAGIVFFFREKIFVEITFKPKIYTLPYKTLSGLVISKNLLWTCDWRTQNIYKHFLSNGTKLKTVHTFSFPDIRFTAVTIAGKYLFSLDNWKKKIYKHNLDDLSIVSEYNLSYSNPVSITTGGKYLFCCDDISNKVYIHKLDENLTFLKEFTLPGKSIIEIFFDGNYLWAADSVENKIYQCIIKEKEIQPKNVFILPEYEKLTAISGDKNYLYFAGENSPKVYCYPKRFLEPI